MMHINCQEYDCAMESLLLCSNRPFHLYSNDTHVTFPPIYLDKRQVNS